MHSVRGETSAGADPARSAPAAAVSSPLQLTVINTFTWPDPPAQIRFTADAHETGGDLCRKLAAAVSYLALDVMLTHLDGSELIQEQTLAAQGLTMGDVVQLSRRAKLTRATGRLGRSSPTIAPSSGTLQRFHCSAFAFNCVEEQPKKPVLLRMLQLSHGMLPDLHAPTAMSRCAPAPELKSLLAHLGALPSCSDGMKTDVGAEAGKAAAAAAAAAFAASTSASTKIAPAALAAAAATSDEATEQAAREEARTLRQIFPGSDGDESGHAMLSELMGVKLDDLPRNYSFDGPNLPFLEGPFGGQGVIGLDAGPARRSADSAAHEAKQLKDANLEIDEIFDFIDWSDRPQAGTPGNSVPTGASELAPVPNGAHPASAVTGSTPSKRGLAGAASQGAAPPADGMNSVAKRQRRGASSTGDKGSDSCSDGGGSGSDGQESGGSTASTDAPRSSLRCGSSLAGSSCVAGSAASSHGSNSSAAREGSRDGSQCDGSCDGSPHSPDSGDATGRPDGGSGSEETADGAGSRRPRRKAPVSEAARDASEAASEESAADESVAAAADTATAGKTAAESAVGRRRRR